MNLFHEWRRSPDKVLVVAERAYTAGEAFGEVALRVEQFDACGVAPGDTVVAAVRPSADFFFFLAALVERKNRLLSLNPKLPATQFEQAVRMTGAQWLLCDDPLRIERIAFDSQAPVTSPEQAGFQLLLQTSGTTGVPKTVPLTWQSLRAHALASERHLGLRSDDIWAACLPVHHIGGLSILFRSLSLGCGVVIQEKMDAEGLNALIDAGTITHVSVVPTLLKRLLDHRGDRPFPGSLQMLLVGGAPLPDALAARARAIRAPIAPTYGMTETCSQICTLLPESFLAGETGCGAPLPGLEVEVRNGEVHVRGETVMRGYLGHPTIEDWFATGDLGEWRNGSLHILDRRTNLIISGGENVYPAEVENVLQQFLNGPDCVVIGLPDDAWGQRVVAVIEAETCEESVLSRHCKNNLAPHQVPKAFLALPQLPRTASGKIQREQLRSMLRQSR